MSELTLTAQEKSKVLEVLCELDPMRLGLPPEMRKWKRQAVASPLWVYQLKGEDGAPKRKNKVFRAITRDISPGGVGLFTKIAFARGDRFIMPVHFAEGGSKLFLCEVTAVRKSPQQFYSIGAKFIDSVEQESTTATIPEKWLA